MAEIYGAARRARGAGDSASTSAPGNVGEDDEDDGDDHPSDDSNSEDSDKSPAGDFFDVSFPSLPPRTGSMTTGVLTLISVADILTLSVGGSTSAFTPCCTKSGSGLQLIILSTVRGEAETVLINFPGLHFPVTKSTVGAESLCVLRGRTGCVISPFIASSWCRTTFLTSPAPDSN